MEYIQFTIVLVLVLGLPIALLFYYAMRGKYRDQLEAEKRLADERIYDSVSGRLLTLEEAERGVVVEEEPRIKTDNEIDLYYEGDSREFEKVQKYLIVNGYRLVEDDTIINKFSNSQILARYRDHGLSYLVEVRKGIYFGVALVSYTQSHSDIWEYQIVLLFVELDGVKSRDYYSENFEFERIGNDLLVKENRAITLDASVKLIKSLSA